MVFSGKVLTFSLMFVVFVYDVCIIHTKHIYIQVIWLLACHVYLALVLPGCHFLNILRQKCHVKIKAKCQNFLVKVSQMTRVPQVEYHCSTKFNTYVGRYLDNNICNNA